MSAITPVLFLIVVIYAVIKKVNVYQSFVNGVSEAVKFVISLIPYLVAVYAVSNLIEVCKIYDLLQVALNPVTNFLGVPQELIKLIIIKPFSGSGALAHLKEILSTYGADDYISRCACVIYSCSETVFYLSAIYFAKSKKRNVFSCIAAVLIANFITVVCACAICRIM